MVDLGVAIGKKPDELKKSAAQYPSFPADLSAAAMATTLADQGQYLSAVIVRRST